MSSYIKFRVGSVLGLSVGSISVWTGKQGSDIIYRFGDLNIDLITDIALRGAVFSKKWIKIDGINLHAKNFLALSYIEISTPEAVVSVGPANERIRMKCTITKPGGSSFGFDRVVEVIGVSRSIDFSGTLHPVNEGRDADGRYDLSTIFDAFE